MLQGYLRSDGRKGIRNVVSRSTRSTTLRPNASRRCS
jgi:hypothetical protein